MASIQEGVDRISDLPDSMASIQDKISDLPNSILCKILSHLPTKNVVATSILSTTWKSQFPFGFLPIHLDLDDSLLLHPKTIDEPNSRSATFLDFFDKVLNATLFDVSRVESIRICCESVKFPDNLSLPKLKSLELYGLSLSDKKGESLQVLLDGCPALEDLSLIRFTCHARVFLIRSNVLKNLTISEGSRFETTDCLALDTPNLEMLTCDCFAAKDHRVSSFKSIVTAHIDIRPFNGGIFGWLHYRGVHNVLHACTSTSRLYLGSESIDMLVCSPELLPTFQNLTWLGLGYVQNDGWVIFGRLVSHAPNLKELICEEGFKNNEGGPGGYLSGFEDFVWPAGDAICLEFHLQKIEFRVFNWTNIEMELLEFFLIEGKVLETLIIRGRPLDIGTEKRLLSFPNHSKIVLESL